MLHACQRLEGAPHLLRPRWSRGVTQQEDLPRLLGAQHGFDVRATSGSSHCVAPRAVGGVAAAAGGGGAGGDRSIDREYFWQRN